MVVSLPLPPTTNHIYGISSIRGRAIMYMTKEGKLWFEEASKKLKGQWRKKTPIESSCEIWINLYLSHDRDIDGSAKPILDLLQKNGVIKNDKLFYKMDIEKHRATKEEARVEFEIQGY